MRSGRRPSPEGTKLLFAGTISPTCIIYHMSSWRTNSQQKDHTKIPDKRQKEGRQGAKTKRRNEQSYVQLVGLAVCRR